MKKGFRKEFKRQIRLAFAASVGFIIAYAWRDFIVNLTKDTLTSILSTSSAINTSFFIAITLTLIGVLLILASSKLLK